MVQEGSSPMLVQVGAGELLLHQGHRDGLAHGEARNDDIAEGHLAHSQHAGGLPVHGLLGGLADEAHVEVPPVHPYGHFAGELHLSLNIGRMWDVAAAVVLSGKSEKSNCGEECLKWAIWDIINSWSQGR